MHVHVHDDHIHIYDVLFWCFMFWLVCQMPWLLDHWHACIALEFTYVYIDLYVVFSLLFSYYVYHSSNSMWIYIMILFMFIMLIYVLFYASYFEYMIRC